MDSAGGSRVRTCADPAAPPARLLQPGLDGGGPHSLVPERRGTYALSPPDQHRDRRAPSTSASPRVSHGSGVDRLPGGSLGPLAIAAQRGIGPAGPALSALRSAGLAITGRSPGASTQPSIPAAGATEEREATPTAAPRSSRVRPWPGGLATQPGSSTTTGACRQRRGSSVHQAGNRSRRKLSCTQPPPRSQITGRRL